jgi:nucleoside-diphosphate-sugar epimerase
LGNVLLDRLSSEDNFIVGVDLGLFGDDCNEHTNLFKDIYDANLFELLKTTDVVIHLSGVSNDPSCELDKELTIRMNLNVTKKLVDYSVLCGVKKFIYASSASVYGSNPNLVNEDSELNPQSLYAQTKIDSEKYIINSKLKSYTILRFGTLFGPSKRMRFDTAINLFLLNAIKNRKIQVFGGDQYRPFLYVDDAADAIIHSIGDTKSRLVNIYTTNVKVSDLADRVKKLTKCSVELCGVSDSRNYQMNSKVKDFGFTPKFTLLTGMKVTAEFITDMLETGTDTNSDNFYTIRKWKEYSK